MARAKRSSTVLETARQRLAGLKSITPAPDFGPGISLQTYEQKSTGFAARLDAYNQKLAALDDEQNGLETDEKELHDLNKRILSATEAQFGPDSSGYELAGGTRLSERKRPTKKTPPPTP